MTLPRIGVTLGDPGGVGPEVALKALHGLSGALPAVFVLFGDSRVIAEEAAALERPTAYPPWRSGEAPAPGVVLSDIPSTSASRSRHGPEAVNGAASFRYFEAALEAARGGRLDALVTGPISKAAWKLAGVPWRGHTERLERLYPGAIMSFWSERLRVALFTHHLPLSAALDRIRKAALLDFFRTLVRSAGRIPDDPPREFLVAGLNPHAGEEGLLGDEEEREIKPAVEAARSEGLNVSGPFPPDTVFRRALGRPEAMAVALYHDQGLIPFKLEAFETGVNATLGLPFVRTAPDHGTAFDIAGQGVAGAQSMTAAVRLAARLISSAS